MGGFALVFGWQGALVAAGGAGVIMGLTVLLAGGELRDYSDNTASAEDGASKEDAKKADWRIMLTRPMILFFLFYIATSASGTGMTNFGAVALPCRLWHVGGGRQYASDCFPDRCHCRLASRWLDCGLGKA